MRLLVLTHRLPFAPNRGDRIRAYHLLKTLSGVHEVHLVSLMHEQEERDRLEGMNGLVASARGVSISRIGRVIPAALTLATSKPLTPVLLNSSSLSAVLGERVRSVRPDVVVAYCSGMGWHALQPPLGGVPCVLDLVDVDSEKWRSLAEESAPPTRWIYRREARTLRAFEQAAARRVSATVVVSERERILARQVLGIDTHVIPNGVDVASFASSAERRQSAEVVFCGVFNYGPNEQGAEWLARQVWPLVKAKVPHAILKLVGMHPSRTVLALANPGSVEVTGAVPDVRPHLWSAAVGAAPLHIARGVQNKVLEAVSAGLPCVVTAAVYEGLPEAVRPACVSCSGSEAFAAALVSLLEATPASRRATVAHARVDGLTWEQQLRPFLDLVEQAARGGA